MIDRGRADPVSVEADLDPPAGTEYLPDEHAIRYVARVRAEDEDPPVRESAYETTPFDDWALSKCARLGRDRVEEVVESRLGDYRGVSYAWGRIEDGPATEHRPTTEHGLAVEVELTTWRDRNGDVVSEPAVEYERLRDATPESVTATVRFAGHEGTGTFPVVARRSTGRLE